MVDISDFISFFSDKLFAVLSVSDYARWSASFLSLVEDLNPVLLVFLFLFSSLVMIWRLNAIESKGFEGTVIGTMVMPYCSGFANLSFAYVMARSGGAASLVLENCIVNNVTNLTLLIGVPSLIWGASLYRSKGKKPAEKVAHLSLILTLIALLFFTSVTWVLARDGGLSRGDGLVLVGTFLFWQLFQAIEVMKTSVRKRASVSKWIFFDLVLIAAAVFGTYYSVERLVGWVLAGGGGVVSYDYLGFISGLLMVIPNGILAFYYFAVRRADIAYSSQIGDAHICIPMCIGLYAIFAPTRLPGAFEIGIWILLGASGIHLLFLGILGRLPRSIGVMLVLSYAIFILKGVPV